MSREPPSLEASPMLPPVNLRRRGPSGPWSPGLGLESMPSRSFDWAGPSWRGSSSCPRAPGLGTFRLLHQVVPGP